MSGKKEQVNKVLKLLENIGGDIINNPEMITPDFIEAVEKFSQLPLSLSFFAMIRNLAFSQFSEKPGKGFARKMQQITVPEQYSATILTKFMLYKDALELNTNDYEEQLYSLWAVLLFFFAAFVASKDLNYYYAFYSYSEAAANILIEKIENDIEREEEEW